MKIRYFVLSGCLSVLLCGCFEKEVGRNLDQEQSRDIIVALADAGISAHADEEEGAQGTKFKVIVAEPQYARALKVLQVYDLPKTSSATIQSLTKSQSFVPPTPTMEAVASDYALSLQAERLLTTLKDVVNVRVVVSAKQRLVGISAPIASGTSLESPRAAVVIRYYSPSGKPAIRAEEIKEVISKIVPNLTADNISVSMSPATAVGSFDALGLGAPDDHERVEVAELLPLLFPYKVAKIDQQRATQLFAIWMLVVMVCAFCLGIGLTVALARLKRRKRGANGRTVSTYFSSNGGRRTPVSDREKPSAKA